ncbi:glutamate racemase [Oceanimonas doudoroffii]|uniref:Glutamate racemase n=1 Tax=Oceanimonas doudoroffii TaxID=84158 RepID=A0A233RDJ7_9GAMM|nr:glutamate racemase [Oceanimonas doudoroffii]OXY81477.1 glutamate racemase [Oceanimonas doudoroffii]
MANILIFDSGMGGLSVYREVRRSLPTHQYFYLFDNACFPYGELGETRLVERVLELLTNFVPKHDIDIVVIACNTASTHVLPALRERLHIPVVGVVPAIKPAAEYCRLHGFTHIGLLATPGTVSRSYTAELVQSFAADMQVSMLGTTELVKMAEDKLAGLPVDMTRLARVLAPWRSDDGPSALVLGCTHFPLLAQELSQCLPGVQLVDSGQAIARRVASLLLQAPAAEAGDEQGVFGHVYCTELTAKAQAQSGAFLGEGFAGLKTFVI